MTAVFEFKLPGQVTQFASFMFAFLSRGIFYVFIGCITLNYGALSIASGVIVALVGIAYIILHFVPAIDPPNNMRKAAFDESVGYAGNSNAGSYPPPQNYAVGGSGPTGATV
ncbi:Late Golgi vesicles protein [Apophysomyces sp. BC1034]|nr:Late Golgi vesicles protein [Apophysomyces sp. BC1021]KAG0192924.1 Late Golgi vesicles protein [Apophysomyces sp. BC1034]